MGKVNACLKYLFFLLNGLCHVYGWFMFIAAVSPPSTMSVFDWIETIGIICISGLGFYAGSTENVPALNVFAGFMGVGMVIMVICGFVDIHNRQQFQGDINNGLNDLTKEEAELMDKFFQFEIGITFGLVAAAVMNLVMSIMMIRQITATPAEEPLPSACNREPPETQSL